MMRSLWPNTNIQSADTRVFPVGRRSTAGRRTLGMAATAAALGLALVSAACGGSDPKGSAAVASGSWNDIVPAAEKEGNVTIYSGQGTDQLQALATAFQKKYPK